MMNVELKVIDCCIGSAIFWWIVEISRGILHPWTGSHGNRSDGVAAAGDEHVGARIAAVRGADEGTPGDQVDQDALRTCSRCQRNHGPSTDSKVDSSWFH